MSRIYNLSAIFFLLLFAVGCRKSDNAKLPALERAPVPLITIDESMDALIQDPAAFKGKYVVDLYFKDDIKPKKMDIVVARNEDYSNVKLVHADVSTFPTSFEITGPQLAALFGIPVTDIKPGDIFEVGANITLQNGRVLPMFSPEGIGYGTGITNLPGSSVMASFRAVCPLNLNAFLGPATIKDPDFIGSNYAVNVTLEGTDVLKITGFGEDPAGVLRLKVNTKTQSGTVASQVFLADFFGYHNAKAQGTAILNACDTKIVFTLAYSVDEGSFGSYGATLVK
jgi:hypothetical protein